MQTIDGWHVVDAVPIEPDWVDHNGHLNMAYYSVIFDLASDAVIEAAGIDANYRATRQGTTMIVEAHMTWRREVFLGMELKVRMRVLARDAKRFVLFSELVEAKEGWLAATSEQLYLHVSLVTRRTAPFPEDIATTLDALVTEGAGLPWPEMAGRRLALPVSALTF